jgi:uncharacterized protein YciI
MRYIAMISQGPNWAQRGSLHEEGAPISEHLESMRRLYREGKLLLGGPFERGGGIAVFDVADEQSAVALMDADPAVSTGVMTYKLHALRPYFDEFANGGGDNSAAELANLRTQD